jgi:alkylhydroperoxidase family enzyme
VGIDLGSADTAAVIESTLAGHPDVAAELAAAHSAAWKIDDPVLLELCRLRIAQLLGCDAEWSTRSPEALAAGLSEETIAAVAQWPTSPLFGERERACLALTEQWVIDVASVTDEQVEAVRNELGDAGLVAFANALLVVEQRQRLRLAWAQLFNEEAME